MSETVLEQTRTFKFLGVIINDQLTWESHKQLIYNKVCKTLGILYKCKETMNETEITKMYKAFIQPYFLYAIEAWGHTIVSEQDSLSKLQSKVLRVIFNCKRSDDAWRHNNQQIISIKQLYSGVIRRLCMKHHAGILPCSFGDSVMPEYNDVQLQNKITRVSLCKMYDYKNTSKSTNTSFKANSVKIWNKLSLDLKALPYSCSKEVLLKHKRFKIQGPLN